MDIKLLMNKTLIDVFEKLKKTKYKDLYQINEKAGTTEEISKTFRELGSRVNTLAFIFFSRKVLFSVSEKIQKVPESKLLTNPDGAMIVLLLGAFSPLLKNIIGGNFRSAFDGDKYMIFGSLFDMDDIKKLKEELREDIKNHEEIFNEWVHWMIYKSDAEKSYDEKLFNVVSNFAVKLKKHQSIEELEKAGEPLLELYNSKEGNEAVWRNERKKHGFPDKTEELYLSILRILVLSDVIYSCGHNME